MNHYYLIAYDELETEQDWVDQDYLEELRYQQKLEGHSHDPNDDDEELDWTDQGIFEDDIERDL